MLTFKHEQKQLREENPKRVLRRHLLENKGKASNSIQSQEHFIKASLYCQERTLQCQDAKAHTAFVKMHPPHTTLFKMGN